MSIWQLKPTVEAVQAVCANTMVDHLGIVVTAIGEDFIAASMPVDHRTLQPAGLLHGGASLALAESLGSVASSLCVDTSRYAVVGLEINGNHIRSVRSGSVLGTARPLHLGRSTHVWEIRVEDERGRLVCISRLTVSILARGEAKAAV